MDHSFDIAEFFSLGYLITRWAIGDKRNDWAREAAGATEPLLPTRVISTSNCVAKHLPNMEIAFYGECNPERAAEYGLTHVSAAGEFMRENTGHLFLDSGECLSIGAARQFVRRFLRQDDPDRLLLGVAVHRRHLEELLKACPPPPQQPGYAPIAPSADYEFLQRVKAPEPGGELMGYDIRVANHQLECSWLCGGHEVDLAREFNIRTNTYGLISSVDDAQRAADYINRPNVGAEPGYWLPVEVLRYSEEG